jgi:hypothetical protein
MADFATWIVACEPSLPWKPGAFLDAYRRNRSSAIALTLDASPLTAPLAIVARQTFHGSATKLLALLENLVEDDVRRKKTWPTATHVLSGQLRRLAPSLRAVGIEVVFDRDSTKRTITIRTDTPSSVMSVTSVKEDAAGDAADADDAVAPTRSNGRPPIPGDDDFIACIGRSLFEGLITEAEHERRLMVHKLVPQAEKVR